GLLTWLLIFLAAPTPFGAKKYLLLLPLALIAVIAARKKITVLGHELLDLSRHHAGDLAMGFFYSLAGQFMSVLANYAAFKCFAVELTFAQVTGISATAALAGIVPLSLLGISMREGSYLGLLPVYGVSPTQSVFIITFFVFTNYLFGLLGGVFELARSGWKISRVQPGPERKMTIE
ncbi:MAG: lysylphosphatidylglycerol synthase domain-containing protein, partial [Endomicrobiales bacterium]